MIGVHEWLLRRSNVVFGGLSKLMLGGPRLGVCRKEECGARRAPCLLVPAPLVAVWRRSVLQQLGGSFAFGCRRELQRLLDRLPKMGSALAAGFVRSCWCFRQHVDAAAMPPNIGLQPTPAPVTALAVGSERLSSGERQAPRQARRG